MCVKVSPQDAMFGAYATVAPGFFWFLNASPYADRAGEWQPAICITRRMANW